MFLQHVFQPKTQKQAIKLIKILEHFDNNHQDFAQDLCAIADKGITIKAIRHVQKQNISPEINNLAEMIADISLATQEIQQGNFDALTRLSAYPHQEDFIRHLTGGQPTTQKIQAKSNVLKSANNNHYSSDFIHEQHQEIIKGYALLSDEEKCREAIRDYVTSPHIANDPHTEKNLQSYLRQKLSGPMQKQSFEGIISRSAAHIAAEYNMLTNKEYLHIIALHPDDNIRYYSLGALGSNMLQITEQDQETAFEKAAFSTLAKHIAPPPAGQPYANSQIKAMQILTEHKNMIQMRQLDYEDRVSNLFMLYSKIGNNASALSLQELHKELGYNDADKYYDHLFTAIRSGDERVLNQALRSPSHTLGVLKDYKNDRHTLQEHDITLEKILGKIISPTEKGEKSALIRQHFASQLTHVIRDAYKDMGHVTKDSTKPHHLTGLVLSFTKLVMHDETLEKNSQNQANILRNLEHLSRLESTVFQQRIDYQNKNPYINLERYMEYWEENKPGKLRTELFALGFRNEATDLTQKPKKDNRNTRDNHHKGPDAP